MKVNTMLIGELAERVGTTTRALRYYEQQGLLQPGRSGNGYRAYSVADVRTVHRIRALLAAGFTSQTVAVLLPCVTGDDEPGVELCPEVAAEMRRTLQTIDDKLQTLGEQRRAVRELLSTER